MSLLSLAVVSECLSFDMGQAFWPVYIILYIDIDIDIDIDIHTHTYIHNIT